MMACMADDRPLPLSQMLLPTPPATPGAAQESSPEKPPLRSQFVCPEPGCGKTYTKKCRLEEHLRSHRNDRLFPCTHEGCGKSFLRENHLKRHMASHCPENKPFACTFEGCSWRFALKDKLTSHMKTHLTPKPYSCPFEGCNQTFSKHKKLTIHLCSHQGIQPYPCTHANCTARFPTPSKLKKHMWTHEDKDRYICDQEGCFESFPKWSLLVQHRKHEHEDVFACTSCDLKFHTQHQLRRHAQTHIAVGERLDFACDFLGCEKSYTQKKALLVHQRTVHENVRKFVCEVVGCGMSFAYKHVLQRHMQTIHGAQSEKNDNIEEHPVSTSVPSKRPLADEISGYRPAKRSANRTITCDHPSCGRTFSRLYDLERHQCAASTEESPGAESGVGNEFGDADQDDGDVDGNIDELFDDVDEDDDSESDDPMGSMESSNSWEMTHGIDPSSSLVTIDGRSYSSHW